MEVIDGLQRDVYCTHAYVFANVHVCVAHTMTVPIYEHASDDYSDGSWWSPPECADPVV